MSSGPKIVKLNTLVIYETPMGFYNYASDFAKWANRAHAEKSKFFSPVPYYLYCRSIELVLKAFLLAKGLTKRQLKDRKLGHNLIALLDRAKKLDLEKIIIINPEWESQLNKANEYYNNKDFEYFNIGIGYHGLPSLNILNEVSKNLLISLKQICLDAADAHPITET